MRSRDVESLLRRIGAAAVARRFGRSLSTARRWLRDGLPETEKERVVKRLVAKKAPAKKKRVVKPKERVKKPAKKKRATPTRAPKRPRRSPPVSHKRGKKPAPKPGRFTKKQLKEAVERAKKKGRREGIEEERVKRRKQVDEIYKDLKKPIPTYRERRRRALLKIRRALKRQKNLTGDEVRALIEELAYKYQLLEEDVWREWRKVYR